MADNSIGAYHLADNPTLYEPMRDNNFEFVVTGLNNLLRAGATGNESNAYIRNAQEVLRFSVVSAPEPMFSQDVITIRRGNSVVKAAGVPTFASGQIVVNDYIGADSKSVLMSWQALSYNVKTEKVGSMASYKKDCYLIEYSPEYKVVRQWVLKGCWVSGLSGTGYNMEGGGKKTITATIEYDKAYPESADN